MQSQRHVTVGRDTALRRLAATFSLPAALVGGMFASAVVRADPALEEIVVTAQRRSEKLQDVPIAVTALSSEDLAVRGVRQAGDVVSSVPNLLLNSPYGPEAQPTFSLRGVTTEDFSQNQSSPIAMYVDQVYKSIGAVQALQVYDLDRVEVLRGPQGTLYGKNATGGAINFYSKNPNLTEYDGYLTAGFGNYNAYTVRAAVGGPIIGNELGWRAAILYERRDGWTRSIVPGVEPLNGVDAVAGRFTLLSKPVDGLTATLKLAVSRSGGTPYGAHALNVDPNVTGFSGNVDWFSNAAKFAVHKDIRNDSASLKLDWELGEHYTLTSVTGFDYGHWFEESDDDALGVGVMGVPNHIEDPDSYLSNVNAFSQEIRFASRDTGAFSWLAGAFYGRESTHVNVQFHFFDSYPGAFILPSGAALYGFDQYNNFDQLRESKALFLNTVYSVTPTVKLRAGVRYTKDQLSIRHFYALEGGLQSAPVGLGPNDGTTLWTQTIPVLPTTGIHYAPGFAPQGALNPKISQDNNNVSLKAGVDWKPNDDILAYASFSQGYRGAAFNGQAYNAPAELTFANPEKLNSYEIGLKSQLWNRRADFNVAVFHYDYRNQQFLDTFALPGGGGTGYHTINAPKSRVDGAEFELRARAAEDLELRAGLGLLHSQYVQLFLHGQDRSGNQLIQAPNVNGNASADWRFARLAAGDLKWEIDANYYAKQYFDALNTQRIAQHAYVVANSRLSTDAAGRHGFSAGIWIKNLANRQYLAYGLAQRNPADGGLGFDYSIVGEPRTYGVDVTYQF
jgi:iron complex outermembrane recepter protein